MIYAKVHDYLDINEKPQQTIASRRDQPDSSWVAYDVEDPSWLSLVNGEIVIAEPVHDKAKNVQTTRPVVFAKKHELQSKAVRVQCLDENKKPIDGAYASGSICKEGDKYFLYTCWHVVTGIDMHLLEFTAPPNRRYLEIDFKDVKRHQNATIVGDKQSETISLYNEDNTPRWIQDDFDIPNADLNRINIRVPTQHDAVKIQLPDDINVFHTQVIDRSMPFHGTPAIGDKLYIVGYPYGYSVTGTEQPTPVVLTRYIASAFVLGRPTHFLLDGAGAAGMSGGPVFCESPLNNEAANIGGLRDLEFVGIYTGSIFPDHIIKQNEKTTVLGTCCNLLGFKDKELIKTQSKLS